MLLRCNYAEAKLLLFLVTDRWADPHNSCKMLNLWVFGVLIVVSIKKFSKNSLHYSIVVLVMKFYLGDSSHSSRYHFLSNLSVFSFILTIIRGLEAVARRSRQL